MVSSNASAFQLRGSRGKALAGTTLGFFFGFASVVLFGITVNYFKDGMSLTPVLVGILIAIPNLTGSLLRIPFGAWVDSDGARKPFLILLFLSLAGVALLFIWALIFFESGRIDQSHFPLLLITGALSGCGIATFSVGIGQVSYWYPQERQGTALGVYAGLGNLAPGLFSWILPAAIMTLGIAWTYGAWMMVILIGIILYWLLGFRAPYFQLISFGIAREESSREARRYGQTIFPKNGAWRGMVAASRIWQTWALVGIYFVTFGGFLALTGWFPTYWKEFQHTDIPTAGLLAGGYAVLASLIRVPGGKIADIFGGTGTTLAALFVTLTGSFLLMVPGHMNISILGMLLMAAGMGTGNAAVFKLVPQKIPEAVGGAAGWVGGLGAFGGFVIPPAMGLFVDAFGTKGYPMGFSIFAFLTVFGLFCILLMAKPGILSGFLGLMGRYLFDLRMGALLSGTLCVLAFMTLFDPAAIKLPDNQQGYTPPQPVKFSHKIHAGDNSIPCLYCHGGAEQSAIAGIPSANVCMNCHTQILPDSPEVQKITLALDTGSPLEWTRVYNLPDFVRFNHSAHVTVGVPCETCHGQVAQMEVVAQVPDLSMGWCVNCHRDYSRNPPDILAVSSVNASTDCAICHY